MDDLHRTGLDLAEAYDALPYETPAMPLLRPRALLGFGAVFGCAGGAGDVLDLGWGTGLQLAEAGAQMPGRLVGVELSAEQSRRARARLAPFEGRAVLHNCDVLDLAPESLGQFDLIHAVGLLFVVPPPVRAHLLRLIGACLKPGGVVVISHYAGAYPAARAWLHRLLLAQVEPGLAPQPAVTKARAVLTRLLARLPQGHVMREAAQQSASLPDNTLYHEVFNPFYGPLPAAELGRALMADGVGFLGPIECRVATLAPQPQDRAFDCDAADLAGGAYHYSLFGKGAQPPDLTTPLVAWGTALRQQDEELYRRPDGGPPLRIAHAPMRAFLNAMAAGPQAFPAAVEDRTRLAHHLRDLWRERLVWAERVGLGGVEAPPPLG